MAFRGEVDNGADMVLLHDSRDVLMVLDVPAFEDIALSAEFPLNIGQVHEIAGIGQLVVVDERAPEVRSFKDVPDEIGPDESGPAGHEDVRGPRVERFCFALLIMRHGSIRLPLGMIAPLLPRTEWPGRAAARSCRCSWPKTAGVSPGGERS